jgi:hypothetical protein
MSCFAADSRNMLDGLKRLSFTYMPFYPSLISSDLLIIRAKTHWHPN